MANFYSMDRNLQRWYAERPIAPQLRPVRALYPGAGIPRRTLFLTGGVQADEEGRRAYIVKDQPGMQIFVTTAENPNAYTGIMARLYAAMLQFVGGR